MKIRVTLTVDVDPDVWYEIYGDEPGDLRQSARSYIENYIAQSAASEAEAIRSVTVK